MRFKHLQVRMLEINRIQQTADQQNPVRYEPAGHPTKYFTFNLKVMYEAIATNKPEPVY
jgi:hypothetical protein